MKNKTLIVTIVMALIFVNCNKTTTVSPIIPMTNTTNTSMTNTPVTNISVTPTTSVTSPSTFNESALINKLEPKNIAQHTLFVMTQTSNLVIDSGATQYPETWKIYEPTYEGMIILATYHHIEYKEIIIGKNITITLIKDNGRKSPLQASQTSVDIILSDPKIVAGLSLLSHNELSDWLHQNPKPFHYYNTETNTWE